ncbi:sensor histidine kinase [Nonomuraea endophytica]|uniref:histidine kinase n=1 Tax=Nonomuraea endophytica TaxID=714136 RepID=A0A7W7ZYT9_9ACTN|nr:histidine kinase [Nonomuraea endophytica]MBB5075800.1 signal transduction histidine kinase [Nonomuraea endophytica]
MGAALIAGGAHVQRGPTWLLFIPLAFVCAGVVVRTHAPIWSLVLGLVGVGIDIAVGPSLGTVLVFTDNLYSAALYGPARLARWLLGITASIAITAGLGAGFFVDNLWQLVVISIQLGLLLVIPVTTAMVLRQQRDLAAAERARAEEVARLVELDRQAAISAERNRMARELHDMIANHFSAIAIQSTAALSRRDLDAETIRTIMESIRENSVKGLDEMRTMIGLLRQEGEETEAMRLRLADAESLVERSRQAGMPAELEVVGEPRELPASVDLAGYRILQEALTNALKHGDPPASVRVVYEVKHVVLTVDNPVNGRKARLPGAGAGVVGMSERAALVGGEIEAGPRADGWRVQVRLPTIEESG